MLWKRPNLTQCIASVAVRQGSSRHPSVADWCRDYSLEGTRIVPHERYVHSLCPQIPQKLEKNLENFIHTVSEIFISDPKIFSTTYTSRLIIHLFISHTNYSDCIQSSKTAVDSERNIHTRSYFHTRSEFTLCQLLSQGFIRTGSYLFIPDPILFMPDLKLLICCWLFQRFWILLLSWLFIRKLFEPGLKIRRWSQVTDWFRKKKKVTGLNISERVNTSPFFIKAEL